jgi:predicted PurR-regulated permease PerM
MVTPQSSAPGTTPGGLPPRRKSDRVIAYALVVLAVTAVLVVAYLGRLVLIPLLTSVLLAFVLTPLVDILERRRVPRALGSGVAVVLMLGALYLAVYFSYGQAVAFVRELPRYSEQIRGSVARLHLQAQELQRTTESMLPEAQEEGQALRVQQAQTWGEILTKSAASLTEFIFVVSFVPFLVYFMLTWQDHVRSATVMLFRMEHRNTAHRTLGLISAMIRRFIGGNLVIGMFLSAASMVVFGLLGLPYFYFIGLLSGFLSLVPYLGLVLALLPPLVAGLGHLGGTEFFIVVAAVFALHIFALNVLYPKLLGRRLQLNPLVMTIALLFWGWLWGGMGLILAVPMTGAMKIIFDHVESLRAWGAWMGE